MMMNLETFFEEKDIPYTVFEIEHNENKHIIDSETVIQYVLLTKGEERTKIAGTLFKLDFQNAPIVDYLRFLAGCMIRHNYDCEDNKQ